MGNRKDGDRLKNGNVTGILHSKGTVQTACRLNRADATGILRSNVLCRQPADGTELMLLGYCAAMYCADSVQTEQS